MSARRRRSLHVDRFREPRRSSDIRNEVYELLLVLARYVVGNVALLLLLLFVVRSVWKSDEGMAAQRMDLKGLESLISKHQFVAVLWLPDHEENNKDNVEKDDKELVVEKDDKELVVEALDSVSEELRRNFSVITVIVEGEEKAARALGLQHFPVLTFVRDGELLESETLSLTNSSSVMLFVTQEEHLSIPERIEEVNCGTLRQLVERHAFVTALITDASEVSLAVRREMESIDDEADVFSIRFVNVQDDFNEDEEELQVQLADLPALLYFRHSQWSVYSGDLMEEEDVLEWLIQQQTLATNESVVEHVDHSKLSIMEEVVDHLLVFFFDNRDQSQQRALDTLEQIDDECDDMGISLVKVDDPQIIADHGIGQLPTLVYFMANKQRVTFPSTLDEDEHNILEWVRRHTFDDLNSAHMQHSNQSSFTTVHQ